jgi:hypothetical protein
MVTPNHVLSGAEGLIQHLLFGPLSQRERVGVKEKRSLANALTRDSGSSPE